MNMLMSWVLQGLPVFDPDLEFVRDPVSELLADDIWAYRDPSEDSGDLNSDWFELLSDLSSRLGLFDRTGPDPLERSSS